MTSNDYHIYRMPYCWHALKHSMMADSYRPINERTLMGVEVFVGVFHSFFV